MVEFLDIPLNDTWLRMTASFPFPSELETTDASVDVLQQCLDIIAARVADDTIESSANASKVLSTLKRMIARRTEIFGNDAFTPPTAESSGQMSQ